MNGYLEKNLFEPSSLEQRHEELAQEMKKRGMKHNSPLVLTSKAKENRIALKADLVRVCVFASMMDLLKRCPECNKRFQSLVSQGRKNEH